MSSNLEPLGQVAARREARLVWNSLSSSTNRPQILLQILLPLASHVQVRHLAHFAELDDFAELGELDNSGQPAARPLQDCYRLASPFRGS